MMTVNLADAIGRAAQSADNLVSDLEDAYREAREINPERRSPRDKALIAYLGERLAAARKLNSEMMNLR